MSSEFRKIKLKDIASFKYGKTIRKKDIQSNGAYPVFSGYQVVGFLPTYMYKEEQLIIVCRGAGGTGDIKISPSSCSITNLAIIITCDDTVIDKGYLYWKLFFSDTHSLRTGSAQPQITINSLESFEINIETDLGKQREIASTLFNINNKISKNAAINQTLEQMAQALFKSWFIDFEPVKAKITELEAGGSQQEATLAAMTAISGKNADALMIFERERPDQYTELKTTAENFPAAMMESKFGEIPAGWELHPFGKLLSHTIGGDWGKDEPDDKHKIPVRIIRGTDIPNIKSWKDEKIPSRYVDEKKLKTRKLDTGDILIEVSGGSPTQPTGRSIYITDNILERLLLPAEPASFCRLLRPKGVELGMILGLHLEMIYQDGKTWMYQNQSTGISNFQTKLFLENEMVTVASDIILKAFYKMTLPFFKSIHSSENIKLAQLRDTLLPKILSGEITLPDAEQAVSEVKNV